MMPITVYKSTDASAPVLDGQIGSLITVLDAILVNGYGAQPAVGWTKEFSDTNKAVYRMPVGSNQHYLQVLDDEVANTHYARVRAYESMTDVDTGVDPFPTLVEESELRWWKSNVSGAAVSEWALFTDGKIFHFAIAPASGTSSFLWTFGEGHSFIPTDNWFTIIVSTDNGNIGSAAADGFNLSEMAMARTYDGLNKSNRIAADGFLGLLTTSQAGVEAYPTNPTAKMNIVPRTVVASTISSHTVSSRDLRGIIGGLFFVICNYDETPTTRASWEDTFTDQNGTVYAIVGSNPTNGAGSRKYAIQISGEWYSG